MGKFYWNFQEDEDAAKSLGALIKYNDGAFKSVKQYKFMYENHRYTSCSDRVEIHKMYGVMLEDDQWMITTSGYYEVYTKYRHNTGIPVVTVYVMDGYGVVRKVKRGVTEVCEIKNSRRYKHYTYDTSKNELKWERDWDYRDKMKHTDYHKEMIALENRKKQKIEEKKAKSDYIGTEGKYTEFTAKIVKRIWIDNDWGGSVMNIMITPDDNKVIWYQNGSSSQHVDEGYTYKFKAKVKKHDNYNEEKQTIVYYLKVKEELEEVS